MIPTWSLTTPEVPRGSTVGVAFRGDDEDQIMAPKCKEGAAQLSRVSLVLGPSWSPWQGDRGERHKEITTQSADQLICISKPLIIIFAFLIIGAFF